MASSFNGSCGGIEHGKTSAEEEDNSWIDAYNHELDKAKSQSRTASAGPVQPSKSLRPEPDADLPTQRGCNWLFSFVGGHFQEQAVPDPAPVPQDLFSAAGIPQQEIGAPPWTPLTTGAIRVQVEPARIRASTLGLRPGSGSGTFACKVPACAGKRWNTHGDFNKHMRYHMPKAQRPLGCNESSECNERFLFKKDLEKHINSVHRKMRFYCTVRGCGKQYKRHDARIRHMTSKHREATILERDDTAVPPTPPTLQSLQTPRVPHISLSPGGSDGAARGPWPAGLSTETSSVSSPVSPRTSFSQFSDSFLDLRSRSGSQSTAPTSVMSSFQKEMPTYATMASMPAHDSRDISKPCRSGMPKHHRLHATSPLPSQRGASKELKTHSAAKGHASSAHISEHLAPSQSKAKRNDEIRLPQRPAGRK